MAVCVDREGEPLEVWLGSTGGAPVAIALDRAALAAIGGSEAQQRAGVREWIAAALPDAISPGDAYARHLHAQVAAEAVNDILANRT
jgi:hypothetical protein